MVEDLDINIAIHRGAIIRADDGLALSSRNQYLTIEERNIAPFLYKILQKTAHNLITNPKTNGVLQKAIQELYEYGFTHVDYLEWLDEKYLQPVDIAPKNQQYSRLFGACMLGKTRLIDNIRVAIT